MSIAEQIQQALDNDSHVRGCKLSVSQTDDSVTIEGTVPSFYLRQMAQETAIRLLRSNFSRFALKSRVSVS